MASRNLTTVFVDVTTQTPLRHAVSTCQLHEAISNGGAHRMNQAQQTP